MELPMLPSPSRVLTCAALACAGFFSSPLAAADDSGVPYWASLRVDEVNMRVGPGEDYRINWVYRRLQLPLKVIRLKEGWRLVRDPDGAEGWVLARFLSRQRGAIVSGKGLAEIHEQPSAASRLKWRVEPGVVGKLGDCTDGWCRIDASGHVGYVEQARLWGAGEP
jgi:SH3-like domain-containing protein